MSQVPNNVVQMLMNMGTGYSNANPNTGAGMQGTWPPEGPDRRSCLIGLDFSQEKIKVGKKGTAQKEIPAVAVTFKWRYIWNQDDPKKPAGTDTLDFKGKTFNLLTDEVMAGLNEDERKRFNYDLERLRGHLSSILRKDASSCVNPAQDLQEVQKLLSEGQQPLCDLSIEYRQPEGSKAVYKTEYVMQRAHDHPLGLGNAGLRCSSGSRRRSGASRGPRTLGTVLRGRAACLRCRGRRGPPSRSGHRAGAARRWRGGSLAG